jgi:zinc protease
VKKSVKVLLIFVLLVGLGTGTLRAETAEENLFSPDLDYSHFELDNGLQIYVLEDHSLPLVNFSVWYKVGGIDEPEDSSGISHLLEHMMFLGTDTLKKDQVHRLVESVGGTNNASTNYDYTRYYEQVPSAKLELAMAIEADRMRNLRLEKEEFNREREVVIQERRQRIENNVFSSSFEKVQAEAFAGSYLEHQVIGTKEDLNNITIDDMKNYYNQYYAPNNAVMVVSGDAAPEQVHKLAQEYYGDYEAQSIKRREFKMPSQEEGKKIELREVTRVPIIEMIYKLPQGDQPDTVAVEALLDILINNSNSRIKSKLQREQQMILQAGGGANLLRAPGFALVYLVPMSENMVTKVQEAFDKELQRLINEGITEEELQIVKKSALKKVVFNQRETSSLAAEVAQGAVRFDDPQSYKTEVKKIRNLTEEDIIKAAEKYFVKTNRTVGYVLPKK